MIESDFTRASPRGLRLSRRPRTATRRRPRTTRPETAKEQVSKYKTKECAGLNKAVGEMTPERDDTDEIC